jgi:hypothetical protein
MTLATGSRLARTSSSCRQAEAAWVRSVVGATSVRLSLCLVVDETIVDSTRPLKRYG